MNERFELFSKMANGLLSYALEAFFGNSNKDKGDNMFILLVLVIALALIIVLLYAGAETVFLLVRKNFGTKGVKKIRAIIASIAFFVLAYLSYYFSDNYFGEIMVLGSEASYWWASITFLFVALVVLSRGLSAGGEDDTDVIDPIYRGDSWLLGGLVKEGVSQSTVQDVAEPLFFLALGFFLFSYNYIWGLPFIFCAISCWFHLAVESAFGFFKDRKELSNEGLVYTQNRKAIKAIS